MGRINLKNNNVDIKYIANLHNHIKWTLILPNSMSIDETCISILELLLKGTIGTLSPLHEWILKTILTITEPVVALKKMLVNTSRALGLKNKKLNQ